MRAVPLLISTCVFAVGLIGAPAADAESTGGTGFGETSPTRAKAASLPNATIGDDGRAYAPIEAPAEVHAAIAAANKIVGKPYRYGGGHAKVEDSGYDCSGPVSYAPLGANLLKKDLPLDSSSFMRWGERGKGDWITVYTNPGHAYVVIAGLRLDTSAAGDPSGRKGPRWRPNLRSSRGFRARHPEGL